jgi:hypothetical protein
MSEIELIEQDFRDRLLASRPDLLQFQAELRKINPGLIVALENPTRSPYVAFRRPNLMWVLCGFDGDMAVKKPALHASFIASQIAMFAGTDSERVDP